KTERTAALGAAVTLARLAEIGEPGLEVALGRHAAKVPTVTVRARNVLTLAERLVGEDLALEADRAERAAGRAERGADLVVGGRPRLPGKGVEELCLAQAVVAADERE